jgi:4-amino-4-deoxy-L-arabinose transferase-like glycosyltransferase
VRALAVLVFLTGFLLLLLHLSRADIRGGEEGRHAVMARNVAQLAPQLLNPSSEPAGPPGATPFLYPALAALFLRLPVPAEAALRLPSVLAILAAALALGALASTRTALAGLAAMGIFLLSPLASVAGRMATPDALAVMLSVLGFAAAVRSARAASRAGLGVAGALLGLSFLCRPWACLPALGGALAAIAAGEYGRREKPLRLLLYPLALFLLFAGSHWILVSLLSPATWGHWLGALLAPLGGQVPRIAWPGAAQPHLWPALAPVLPLATLGLLAYIREPGEPLRLGTLAWSLTLLLSMRGAPDVPGTLMLLPCLALFCAAGARELARWSTEEQWKYPWTARLLLVALLVAAAATWLPALSPAVFPLGGPLPACADLLAWAALTWLVAGRYATPHLKLGLAAAGVCSLLALQIVAGSGVRRQAEARNGYRDAGALLESRLQAAALDATAFLAPDPEALAFYSYRRGDPWSPGGRGLDPATFQKLADGRHARAYILPADPQAPPAPWVRAWLFANTTDLTPEMTQRMRAPAPCQVYVNGNPKLPQLGPTRPTGVPVRKAILRPGPPVRHYRRL